MIHSLESKLNPCHCFPGSEYVTEKNPYSFSTPEIQTEHLGSLVIQQHKVKGGRKRTQKEKSMGIRKVSQYKDETLKYGKNVQDFS